MKHISLKVYLFLISLGLSYLGLHGQSNAELLEMIDSSKDNAVKVEALIKLSRNHSNSDPQLRDIEYASEAVDLAFNMFDRSLYAKSLDNLGLIYRFREKYEDALELHKKAFELIKDIPTEPALQKMIYANNAGLAARHHSKYQIATDFYLQALEIAKQNNDNKNISISSNGLGITYMSIPGMQGKALQYLFKSLEIAKAQDNIRGTAMNYIAISDYYIEKEKFDSARYYLHELLAINTRNDDQYGIAMTYLSLSGAIIKENKNLEQAEQYLKEALDIFVVLDNKRLIASAYNNLGDLYKNKNQLSESLKMYKQSLALAESLNQRILIANNSAEISALYEKLQQFKNALYYSNKASAYKDSVNLDNQKTEIAILDRKFDISTKEQQIDLLKKDKILQESQIAIQSGKVRSRGIIIILLISLMLVFIAFIVLQNLNKNKNKQIEELISKSEKEKTQAEYDKTVLQSEILAQQMRVNPHLIFNCLNAIKYLIQIEEYKKADTYLLHFSRYIRLVLETSKAPTISINEEIELITQYLNLEKIRFMDEFDFQIQNLFQNHSDSKILIPTLILQPYVENAIWHGLLPKLECPKTISIKIERDDKNQIIITIDDNGVGRLSKQNSNDKPSKNSLGNKINLERIRLYNEKNENNSKLKIKIIDKEDDQKISLGTTVILIIQENHCSVI